MLKDETFKNKPANSPRRISRSVKATVACLFLLGLTISICLTVMAVTDRFASEGKGIAEVQDMRGPAQSGASKQAEQQGIPNTSGQASKKFEPLIMLSFGTMLLSIGAAIKIAMTRNR